MAARLFFVPLAGVLAFTVALVFATPPLADEHDGDIVPYVEGGAGSFNLSTDVEVGGGATRAAEIDGSFVSLEVGLREIAGSGAWASLSHVSSDADTFTYREVSYPLSGGDDFTALNAGWEWIVGGNKNWHPYVGLFLGTDSAVGGIGGIRYRWNNGIELGGRLSVGSLEVGEIRDQDGTPVLTSGDWTLVMVGVTLGYVF